MQQKFETQQHRRKSIWNKTIILTNKIISINHKY